MAAILGIGYALYGSRNDDADPVRAFRRHGKIAGFLGGLVGAIWSDGATFLGSYGGKVLGLSIEGAGVGALAGMIAGFLAAVLTA